MHDRLTVLWRQQEWSCEYLSDTAASSGGTIILFMGSVIAVQHSALNLHEVLRVSSFWREVIVGPANNRATEDAEPPFHKREGPWERRRVPRGGRRKDDPGRSQDFLGGDMERTG